jgi:hypothetical protein
LDGCVSLPVAYPRLRVEKKGGREGEKRELKSFQVVKELRCQSDLLHPGGAPSEQSEVFETPKESLLLRSCCPPSLVERLRANRRLHAFARLPEREHQVLKESQKEPVGFLLFVMELRGCWHFCAFVVRMLSLQCG